MSTNFLSYVPHHVAQQMLEQNDPLPLGEARHFEAVTLFADVSGFTAMSEALGKSGKIGTEELTQVLNSYFDPMIALVKSYGGIVGKFGGDAMTILFPYDGDTQADAVRRGLRCALDMQRDMVNYENIETSQGVYGLAMKAGLAMGTIFTTVVGDSEIRLEFIIAGEPIDLCSDAEHHATRGEVMVHDPLLEFAPDAVIAEARDGFSLITDMTESVNGASLPTIDFVPDTAGTVFSRYLHPVIAARLRSEQTDFIDEHRRTTVLFVSFDGFDYDDDPAVGEKLQAYFRQVIGIIDRYGGYLNKIDMGDKGSKYIILFGAPVASEQDEERALRCALEIREIDVPGHGLVRTRTGINTGDLYAGRVGSQVRQEYTAMGDSVNLSARLMQFAQPGQIIVRQFTRQRAVDVFTWDELDAINVKGKTESIEIVRLTGVSAKRAVALSEPEYALPMVGRKPELVVIRERLAQARDGAGGIVGVQGEAGMGKSRLGAEAIGAALTLGFAGYGGACQSFNITLGYMVWRGVWRGFFDLDPAQDDAQQITQIEAVLHAIDPVLLPRLPLLGPVVGITIADNDFTETLDADLRTELRYDLLLTCLRARAGRTPLLLILEDCHWMDSSSADLLAFLGRNIAALPVVILMLYRPPYKIEEDNAAAPVRDLPHFVELVLDTFSNAEAAELIRLKLAQLFEGIGDVAPALVERITARAQGNPFYIEELMNLLRDRAIDPTGPDALREFDLPDTLQQLILSRIDGLSEDEKSVIKVASIIGRVFRASWVYGSYPEIGVPQMVIDRLDRLDDLELTPLDQPEPELEYLFRHLLTQEVAYDTMAFAVRNTLHERLGDFIAERYTDNRARYYDVIAYHYGMTNNEDKQRTYFRLAGDHAKKTYALPAAVYYYERLLPLLVNGDRSRVQLSLGEVLRITGDWERAESLFREALDAGLTNTFRAECQTALGDLLSFRETYSEAIDVLSAAQTTFTAAGDNRGLNQALKHLSFAHLRSGDYDRARSSAEQQFEAASAVHDRVAISEARQNIGLVEWYTGDFDAALSTFDAVTTAARDSGYTQGVIYAGSNIAGLHFMRGDYAGAMDVLREAVEEAQRIGYVRALAALITNMGSTYVIGGQTEDALACYQHGLEIGLTLGDWTMIVTALVNMAMLHEQRGEYNEAAALLERGLPLSRRLEALHDLALALRVAAQLSLEADDLPEALQLTEEAAAIAQQVNNTSTAFEANLLLVRARRQTGDLDDAAAVGVLDGLRATFNQPQQEAELDDVIWQMTDDDDARRSAADRYRVLFDDTPTPQYRERYITLTGDDLPEPPSLPAPPPGITFDRETRAALLTQIDAYLEG